MNSNSTTQKYCALGKSVDRCELDINVNIDWNTSMSEEENEVLLHPEQDDHHNNKENNNIKPTIFLYYQYRGIALSFFVSLLYSVDILLATLLQKHGVDGKGSVFWIYAGLAIWTFPILLGQEIKGRTKSTSIFDTVWPLNEAEKRNNFYGLLVPGIIGPIVAIFRYTAIEYIPMADAAVIFNSSPIIVGIMGHFILGEKTGIIQILTSIWALIGVVIISKPPALTGTQGFDSNTLVGTGIAIGALVLGSLQAVITRKIRSVHSFLVGFVIGIFGLIETSIFIQMTSGFSLPVDSTGIILLLALATCSSVAQTCFILALTMETVGVISLVQTTGIVFVFLSQLIFLGILPDLYSVIGGFMIFSGVFITSFRKYLSMLPQDKKIRKKFAFLLD